MGLQLARMWREDVRGLRFDREAYRAALQARRPRSAAAKAPLVRQRLLAAAETIERQPSAPRRSVELIGPQLPIDTDRSPRALVEARSTASGCQ